MASTMSRCTLTHLPVVVIAVDGFSKRVKARFLAVASVHMFGLWRSICELKLVSRIAKVSRAIQDLLGLNFTPAALIGFETWLSEPSQPIVEDIEKKIASNEGPVHADETYWTLDGNRAYYWVHTD